MLLIGLLVGVADLAGFLPVPVDTFNYWRAGTSLDLYPERWGDPGVGQWLYYPPFVAQVSRLIQPIGWNAFVLLLSTGTFLAMWYCLRRWSLPVASAGALAMYGILPSTLSTLLVYALIGNLQWILAALTLVAIRHPTVWSLELLTKVTPAIGWWWHAVRGEWKPAVRSAVVAGLVVAASVALSPDDWSQFIRFAMNNGSMANPPPIPTFPVAFGPRLATGAILVVWGARSNHAWTIPVAAGWVLPAVWGIGFLPFWAAATRLIRMPSGRWPARRLLVINTPELEPVVSTQ
jgi:hypothetical protein